MAPLTNPTQLLTGLAPDDLEDSATVHAMQLGRFKVQLSLKIREQVQARVIEPITGIEVCIYCKSEKIKKDGLRRNKYGDIQKFRCLTCGRYFTINFGFERMKHNPQGITTAMQLYFSGESLRNTARSLRLLGVEVTHKTVFMWIKKYTGLMEKYVEKITPQVSNTWRADEMYLKVKGNLKYLYAMMDEQTRFWIAQEVAETKYTADMRPLFQLAKAIAGKTPSEAAGIKVEGENKWLTLIQNASRKRSGQ